MFTRENHCFRKKVSDPLHLFLSGLTIPLHLGMRHATPQPDSATPSAVTKAKYGAGACFHDADY